MAANRADPMYDPSHAQYAALQTGCNARIAALRADGEVFDPADDLVMDINLPFPVQDRFCNPFNDAAPNRISLGVYPLPREEYPAAHDGRTPAPSTKFLHLHVRELHGPMEDQNVGDDSFF